MSGTRCQSSRRTGVVAEVAVPGGAAVRVCASDAAGAERIASENASLPSLAVYMEPPGIMVPGNLERHRHLVANTPSTSCKRFFLTTGAGTPPYEPSGYDAARKDHARACAAALRYEHQR